MLLLCLVLLLLLLLLPIIDTCCTVRKDNICLGAICFGQRICYTSGMEAWLGVEAVDCNCNGRQAVAPPPPNYTQTASAVALRINVKEIACPPSFSLSLSFLLLESRLSGLLDCTAWAWQTAY